MKFTGLFKYLLWVVLAIPAAILISRYLNGYSPKDLLHPTGEFSARMMIIAMAATPLSMLFKRAFWTRWLVLSRRYFGVAAFGYALLHVVFYIEKENSLKAILGEFWELGIWTGWAAFFIFLPLAFTSNNFSQRWLGRRWKSLQRWVYVAAVLTLAHWVFLHNNFKPALVNYFPLIALECYRIFKLKFARG